MAVAARTTHDGPGPHVVTGPIAVRGAPPGDVLKIEVLYLPVQVPGALFFAGDPHMAQGDGEVALTAMEGSLRPTFRLTVVKKGQRGAPRSAFDYPFAENPDFWIPIGLSDPDGPESGGNATSLDIAMRTAVRHALEFLVDDVGMAGPGRLRLPLGGLRLPVLAGGGPYDGHPRPHPQGGLRAFTPTVSAARLAGDATGISRVIG